MPTPVGKPANDTGEHCWAGSVCTSARSGNPVAAPALSLQPFMALTSARKIAVVPTVANESVHASATAALDSSAVRCESTAFTTTLRHARPPLELMYSPHPFMPSHEPLNRPGRKPFCTSAITVTVMVLSVTPTSGLVNAGLLHTPRWSRPERSSSRRDRLRRCVLAAAAAARSPGQRDDDRHNAESDAHLSPLCRTATVSLPNGHHCSHHGPLVTDCVHEMLARRHDSGVVGNDEQYPRCFRTTVRVAAVVAG